MRKTTDINNTEITLLFAALQSDFGTSGGLRREVIELIERNEFQNHVSHIVKRLRATDWRRAEQTLCEAEKKEVKVLTFLDKAYPRRLRAIPDAPLCLYVRGDLSPYEGKPAIGIVGSRAASTRGVQVARDLAEGLCQIGVSVVSGLALGIDSAAHFGAVSASKSYGAKARSGIGVLGSGVLNVSPRSSISLAEELLESGGALVSEYALHTEGRKNFFPERNRIISGLSDAIIVVEATERSGSLITARMALEQGREVLAVPGPAESPKSRGTHLLIRNGAVLVRDIKDILTEFPNWTLQGREEQKLSTESSSAQSVEGDEKRCQVPLNGLLEKGEREAAKQVLELLEQDGMLEFEAIAGQMSISTPKLSSLLSLLELSGVIESYPGKFYSLS